LRLFDLRDDGYFNRTGGSAFAWLRQGEILGRRSGGLVSNGGSGLILDIRLHVLFFERCWFHFFDRGDGSRWFNGSSIAPERGGSSG